MSSSSADTNLLFGILALQLDFISRDQLVEGMHAWVLNKSQSLGAVLVEKAHLAPDRRSLLDALVQEHLRQHQGDAEKSLAALSAVETSVQKDLERLCDSHLNASLKTLSVSPALSSEPNATGVVSVGFPTSSVGRFRILRPHARGGLGQISIAYDEELNREVALKEIQPEHASCPESRRRFVQEAEVTGSLEHPGIVPVYGMGTYADGRPFYAMRFIEGNSLKKAIYQFHQGRDPQMEVERDPELNQLLGRFLDVCNAIAYAHSRGVLHRDLKPGNIMLGTFGETLVVDWGLAKRLNQQDPGPDPLATTLQYQTRSEETLPGSAVGTPQYMSPEQASGDIASLGPLTDVYSLGAILFEIMTGSPPHEGKDSWECLAAAAQNKIVPTQQTGELMDIAYRAMSTRPEDRYQSITELSEAIREYLTHRESHILATAAEADFETALESKDYDDYVKAQLGFEEALKLWDDNSRARIALNSVRLAYAQCAMNRGDYELALSLLDSSSFSDSELRCDIAKLREERDSRQKRLIASKRVGKLLLAMLFLVVTTAALWINIERNAAIAAKDDAVEAEKAAVEAKNKAIEGQKNESRLRKAAEEALNREQMALRQAAEQGTLVFVEQRAKLEAIYAEKKAKQQAIIAVLNAALAEDAAESERIAKNAEQKAKDDAISAQKKAEEAAEKERLAKLAELKAKEDAITAQKKTEKAAEAERKAKLIAVEAKIAGEREAYISKVGLAAAKIEENAFDAARDLLQSTNPRFRNWEWGYLMHLCEGYVTAYRSSRPLEACALIGDGEEFVAVGQNGLVEIRKTDDPKVVVETLPKLENVTIYDVAVSPNKYLIALATDDAKNGFIKLWDRDQKTFWNRQLGLRDVSFHSELEYWQKHETSHMDRVISVQFSQDGSKLLTASLDQSARVWNVVFGKQLARLYGSYGTKAVGHKGFVWDAAFCPKYEKDRNGQTKLAPETKIVTVSEDGTVLVWVDHTGEWNDQLKIHHLPALRTHQGPVYSVACSPDGQYVATGGYDHRVLIWRPDDLPQMDQKTFDAKIVKGEFVPQTPYHELVGHKGPVRSVSFGTPINAESRDLVLVSGGDDNTVKIWKLNRESFWGTQNPIKTFRGHGGDVQDCLFDPQGTWILSVSHDRTALRWSLDDSASSEVYLVNGTALDGHKDHVDAVGFSFITAGQRIVTAGRDRTAQIYALNQANHWQREHVLHEGHETPIPTAIYFDEGRWLATAGLDQTVRVWDVLSGTEQFKLVKTGSTTVIAVSPKTPQGQWILTGSDNQGGNPPWKAKLWDAKTGQMVATFGSLTREVTAVAFANKMNAAGHLPFATADASGSCILWTWSPSTSTANEIGSVAQVEGQNVHINGVIALRFLPDDAHLLSAGSDNVVRRWSLPTRKEESRLSLKHPASVTSLDLSADGQYAVTTCADGVIRLWNVEAAQVVHEFRPEGRLQALQVNVSQQFSQTKQPEQILERAWKLVDPDGGFRRYFKERDREPGVEELLSCFPAVLEDLNEPPRELAKRLAELFTGVSATDLLLPITSSAAISPDNHYIVAVNRADRIVYGWHLSGDSSDQPLAFLIDDGSEAWSAAFSPVKTRTDLVILGFSDARQWKLNITQENTVQATPSITLNAQGEVASASFSPGGEYLVTGTRDKAARVWNVKTGRGVVKLQGVHKAPVNAAVFAPKSLGGAGEEFVLTASDDATAVLWKLIPEGADTFKAEVVRTFKGHNGPVTDAAFSPDGQWIVTVSEDQTARLWNTASGEQAASTNPASGALLCVAFCGDGQRILTGSANNQAVIWDIQRTEAKAELKQVLLLQGHSAPITDVAFSPGEDLNGDGQINGEEGYGLRAVTASQDNSVIVWDTRVPMEFDNVVPQANQVLTLKRHNRPVKAVKFSPDGRYILTGSEDRRAILWPTKDWMADKLTELKNVPVSDFSSSNKRESK